MGADALNERRYERQRRELIERIRERGVDDLEVLRAIDLVPRHLFLPESVHHRAYDDAAVPIGHGQTASQPSLIALYLQTLHLGPRDRVLEVGTGTGWQTALLARLASQVFSIERIRELSVIARELLDRLRIRNVALLVGDGTIGWSRFAPYDAILVAAGAPDVPKALLDQLAVGGRLLIPIGGMERQDLVLVRKTNAEITRETVTEVAFVPLLGRFGWNA